MSEPKKLQRVDVAQELHELAAQAEAENDAHLEILSAIEDRLAALACYNRAELILRWAEANRPDSGIPISADDRKEFALLMKQAAPFTIPAERLSEEEPPSPEPETVKEG